MAIASPQTSQMAIAYDRIPSTPQTANCLQQRFAIAPPQPPKQQSHSLNLPKQRTDKSALTLSHSLNLPNSELTSQRLRYRTPSTPQTAN